jgi:hypothetical protein
MTRQDALLLAKMMDRATTHRGVDDALDAANAVLGGHGVEALPCEYCFVDRYYQNIIALYVNMGDTYDTTIYYDTNLEIFRVGSWGDFFEAHESQHENEGGR